MGRKIYKSVWMIFAMCCMIVLTAVGGQIIPLAASAKDTAVCFNYDTEFPGDKTYVDTIVALFEQAGYYALNQNMPKVIYGYNYNLSLSDVVFSSSHGVSSGGILVLDGGTIYDAEDVPAKLEKLKFIYLSACYSTKTNSVTGNLGNAFLKAGVASVVGYTDTVRMDISRYFETQFFKETLINGLSVSTALGLAKARAASEYSSNNTVVTSSNIIGNGSITIR